MKNKSTLHTYIIYLLLFINIINSVNSQQTNQNVTFNSNNTNPNIQPLSNYSSTAKSQQKNSSSLNANTFDYFKNFNQYRKINSSSQYYELFSSYLSKISFSQVVNVTNLSNGKQICKDSNPCQFFYYVIKPKFDPQQVLSFQINKNNNVKNIFIVAGMHGNQYLGPTAILYALKYLQTPGTRIIMFPLSNPSGFDHNQRLTFPSNLDPNRDYPIQQNKKCYQTSSTLIIDHIYRKYHIDLTLALHNGRSQIGWNWGTMNQKNSSQTKDQPIYRDIGQYLKFIGGYNKKLGMQKFRIGTMNQVIYPALGAFQDWAYAAQWYNGTAPTVPTRSCPYQNYPFNMTNGLVFLFQIGPFVVLQKQFGSQQGVFVHPYSTNYSNGYISRAVRMLSGLTKLPNPRLQLKFSSQSAVMKLNGCKRGKIQQLRIWQKYSNQTFLQLKQKIQIQGNINNHSIQPSVINLNKKLLLQDDNTQKTLIIQYLLSCDKNWNGVGNTIFGQNRQFHVKQSLILVPKQLQYSPKTFYSSTQQAFNSFSYIGEKYSQQINGIQQFILKNSQLMFVFFILFIVLLLVIFIIYTICKEIRKDAKQRKMKRLKQKIQKVNSQAETSTMSQDDFNEGITMNEINIRSKKQKSQIINKPAPKVESYPQMCESDKSMKTDQLEQILQLQQFIKRYQNMSQNK